MAGKLLLILCAFVVIYTATAYLRAFKWEPAAAHYSRESMEVIAKPWNVNHILSRASLTLKTIPTQRIEQMVESNNLLLGSFIHLNYKINCSLFSGSDTYDNKKHTYATCDIPAKFEKKSVHFMLQLLYERDEWFINNMQIK